MPSLLAEIPVEAEIEEPEVDEIEDSALESEEEEDPRSIMLD